MVKHMPLAWRTALLTVIGIGVAAVSQTANPRIPRIRWDWRHSQELTRQQSISRNKKLSPPERNRLIDAIVKQLPADLGSEEELKKIAAESRIEYIDLNNDGKKEVIVQAGSDSLCSPTGNCPFWAFEKHDGEYRLLLNDEAQTFTLQPERTNGFQNLVLTRHGSAFSSDGEEFRFSDGQYRQTASFGIEWYSRNHDGAYDHPLKAPRITPQQ